MTSPIPEAGRPRRLATAIPSSCAAAAAFCALLLLSQIHAVQAGSYGPQAFSFSNGTTSIGGGTVLSSNNGVASIQSNSLRLTRNGTTGTSSSFKLSDLDAGLEIDSFDVDVDVRMYDNSGNPADGWSLTFGDIPAGDGGGEAGFAAANSLIIAFDTYDNGGDPRSIEVFSNGVSIGNYTQTFPFSQTQFQDLVIHWDANSGLDLSYRGTTLASNLATPGFVPSPGNSFAFSGRTGGATQDTYIDNLAISTTTSSPLATPDVIISEFVADNADGLEDEDLDEPDWVELYNGTAGGSVNLSGWYLTNDAANLTMWQIPSGLTLAQYEYLSIFCSGKNRSSLAGKLHTNFTIPKAGGYLALVKPNGTTIASSYTFGPQAEDVAFGIQSNSLTTGYLEVPSPGTKNTGLQEPGPPAEEIVFSQPGGLFTTNFSLTIATPVAAGAVVRYTTNNTIPTTSSALYTGPISITSTRTVRARVFETGKLPGPVKSRTFLKLASDVQGFQSNLPVMVVDTNGVNIDNASNPSNPRPYRPVYAVTVDADPMTAVTSITGPSDWNGRGGMHVRGQSSSGFAKKQYSFEAWDNFDEDKDVSILGMPSESDWIIHAPYSDKTLMRNHIVYNSARELNGNFGGVRSRFVELFVNDNGGTVSLSDYRGVYVFMERIKRGKDRINVEKLNDCITDPAQITGGYIFKKDKPPHDVTFTTSVEQQLIDFVSPAEPNTAQQDYLRDYVNAFENALHGPNRDDPDLGYAQYIDVQSWIDTHLFVEVFKEIDGYRISSYFSKKRDEKIRAIPIWDYNLALGNANYLEGQNPQGWYYPQISSYPTANSQYPWYEDLFKDEEFVVKYWDRYFALRKTVFDYDKLCERIDAYAQELQTSVNGNSNDTPEKRNFAKWDILGDYVWPNADGYQSRTTHQAEVDWMKNWLSNRLAWIDSQYANPPDYNKDGGNVPAGFDLTMTNPNAGGGTIFYTTDGTDPRVPPGQAGPEITLVSEFGPATVKVPTSGVDDASWKSIGFNNDASWTSGNTGVGYENNPGAYQPLIGVDIGQTPGSQPTSAYIRCEFNIPDAATLASYTTMNLRMKYDDGFVAYINGTQIASSNAPGSPAWNSNATGSNPDSAAMIFEEFDATATGIPALVIGSNVLAVHGLNLSTTNSDMLTLPELVVQQGPAVLAYSGPVQLNQSGWINARVLNGGNWSALRSCYFIVDAAPATASNTVVSELHYRPQLPNQAEIDAGYLSRGEFEFVELQNISGSNIDMTDVQFTDGITFHFSGGNPDALTVPPGGRVVVVSNQPAFEMRYASSILSKNTVIAGTFGGSLSNDGETVTLVEASTIPVPTTIKSFTYNDVLPWPVDADGNGFSLVLKNPPANPDHNDPASWRSSTGIHGCPGGTDTVTFVGTPTNDSDGDGTSDIVEHALGSDAGNANSTPEQSLTIDAYEAVPGGGFSDYFTFSFTIALAADDVVVTPEISTDMETWMDDAVLVSYTNNGDGTETHVYRSLLPITDPSQPTGFARLSVEHN